MLAHAKRPYKCDDCSCTIQKGELYYRRNFDRTVYCMKCYQRRYEKWKSIKEAEPARLKALLDDLMRGARKSDELHKAHGGSYIGRLRKLKRLGYPIGREEREGTVIWYLERHNKWCRKCNMQFTCIPMAGIPEQEVCESCARRLELEEDTRVNIANEILEEARESGVGHTPEEPTHRACLVCGQASRVGTFCSSKCAEAYLMAEAARGNSISQSLPPERESTKTLVDAGGKVLYKVIPAPAIVHLAGKAKLHNVLNSYQRRALFSIGHRLLTHQGISSKQADFLEKLLRECVSAGLVDMTCEKNDCKWCAGMKAELAKPADAR